MRKKKLPGFGRLGAEILDINLATASEAEILELGQEHLCDLVTVIRKEQVGGISLERFRDICAMWAVELPEGGYVSGSLHDVLGTKYGPTWWEKPAAMDEADRKLVEEGERITKGISHLRGMTRVTGKRDAEGNHTGMFADGELDWHSNQQGTTDYAPVVGLLAWDGSAGSRTEFLNAVDAYEALSPEWQRTADQLVAIHRWHEGAVAPGLNGVQDRILQLNMCPVDDVEVPLVNVSPHGYKGLHFPFATIDRFAGMTRAESDEALAFLKAHVLQERFIYGHDWQDGDLLFFDNTVTLHRRPTKDCSRREMYRMCFNYDRLLAQRAARAARAD
jgi:alpha-ketoglutarate-dependent taurine dioxygenase